jgi:hypothetical protein
LGARAASAALVAGLGCCAGAGASGASAGFGGWMRVLCRRRFDAVSVCIWTKARTSCMGLEEEPSMVPPPFEHKVRSSVACRLISFRNVAIALPDAVLEFWVDHDHAIGVVSFGSEPGFEQLLITAAQSIFQIQKRQTGSL